MHSVHPTAFALPSSYINGAGILASDMPAEVVRKLDAQAMKVHGAAPLGEQGSQGESSALPAAAPSAEGSAPLPIDMLLFCPACGMQHIDAPEPYLGEYTPEPAYESEWTNPPHKSHLCHGCRCIWRPADVPTNGVARITTTGKADNWHAASPAAAAGVPTEWPEFWELLNEWATSTDEERRDWIERRFGELFRLAASPVAPVGVPQLTDERSIYLPLVTAVRFARHGIRATEDEAGEFILALIDLRALLEQDRKGDTL